MIDLKEFIKRSADGPIMSEKEYDLKLSKYLRSLSTEYGIRFNPTEIICDDVTADAIFKAAVEMLAQVGLYNVDTSRAILLSREEVEETRRETPKKFTRGDGKDAVTVMARSHNSPIPPHIFCGPTTSRRSGQQPQQVLSDMVKVHLSERSELGDLARELKAWLEGVDDKADTVGEMMWNQAVIKWNLAIARATGRPNAYLGLTAGISVPAILACFREDLYRPFHTAVPSQLMPELKMNWDRLKLAFVAREMKVPRWIGYGGILGGYARNAEETAVVVVASILGQLSYTAADWAYAGACDVKGGYYTARRTLQASCGACRAAVRNIGVAMAWGVITKNGSGTALSLYEEAAAYIAYTCSGMAWSWGYLLHPGQSGEPKTDLSGEMVNKVVQAVSGMEREEANELANKVVGLYEPHWDQEEKGRPYSYYYDLKTLTPSQELVDLHRRVEEKLASLGVPLS